MKKNLRKARQKIRWSHQSPQTCLRIVDDSWCRSQVDWTASSTWPHQVQTNLLNGCLWIHHHGPASGRWPPIELFLLSSEGPSG